MSMLYRNPHLECPHIVLIVGTLMSTMIEMLRAYIRAAAAASAAPVPVSVPVPVPVLVLYSAV